MDKPNIDLFALRSFCALMDERSVSSAAARLGVRQSKMSRQLACLRDYFKDPLLVWAGGSMVPTPRALALTNEVRQAVDTMDSLAIHAPKFDAAASETTLELTATGYMEEVLLTEFVGMLAMHAPKINVAIRLPDRLHDSGSLERGELDFLVGWSVDPPPILRSRPLFTDKLVCIARAGHPVLHHEPDLTRESYLNLSHVQYAIPGRTTTERVLQELLSREGRRQDIRYHVQNPLTVVELVARSDLIATVPERFAARCVERYGLRMFQVPFPLPPMENRLYWHECMHSDPRNRWFRKLFEEVAKTI